jgi:hypothetical protein
MDEPHGPVKYGSFGDPEEGFRLNTEREEERRDFTPFTPFSRF